MRVSVDMADLDKMSRSFASCAAEVRRAPSGVSIQMANPARNAMLAEVHAKHRRDPFYLSPADYQSRIRPLIDQIAGEMLTGGALTRVRALLREIGERMITAFRRHIDLGLSAERHGAMVTANVTRARPLTPRYAERKRRLHGPKPILRATDEFYRAMRARVIG